jgi:hypothetical protein
MVKIVPIYTYEDKMELKNHKSRKKNSKKPNSSPKKSLLEKESQSIKDVYDI